MAISIKNYVDISTTFPLASVAGRSFGGMVFTKNECLETAAELMPSVYKTLMGIDEPIGVAFLTLNEVGVVFGTTSPEYDFANQYYSYISPSGRFASILGFSRIGTVTEGGVARPETALEAFERVNAATNMFGSFTFLNLPEQTGSTTSTDPGFDQLVEVANYNSTLGSKYLFVINRPASSTYTSQNAIADCAKIQEKKAVGTCFVYGASEVSAYMPMALFSSTDYADGQVINFMFKQFPGETPTVFTDVTYREFNASFVNFYGRTQTNGQTLEFYQRGYNTDGMETSVYCNEVWFKAACETAIMNLILGMERLPADAVGVSMVKLAVVDCCSNAVRNDMFMPKTMTALDIRAIREIIANAGGEGAEVDAIETDVSGKGYSVFAYLRKDDASGERIIQYYVFYGTADSIRVIKGNDILLK